MLLSATVVTIITVIVVVAVYDFRVMDARYKLYCDFRDAYVAAHSSLEANQISINKFPFVLYADVRKGG